MRETETNARDPQLLELHIVELPKFIKTVEELTNDADRWIYLLKNAEDLHAVPAQFKTNTVMRDAFDILERGSWNRDEMFFYHAMVKQARDERGRLSTMHAQGLEEGRAEGHEKGIQEGIEKGIVQGKKEGIEQGKKEMGIILAKQLLKNKTLTTKEISDITKLTLNEIEALKKK